MTKKLVSLFMVAVFSISFVAQGQNAPSSFNEIEGHLVQSDSKVAKNSAVDLDCSDSDDSNCNHTDSHCSHHCSGLHNLIPLVNLNTVLFVPTHATSKGLWYFNNHYKTPLLDPALKPPTHS